MNVTPYTNLDLLLEIMPVDSTVAEAVKLRDLMVKRGATDTDKISDTEWASLISAATA
jgi:hypothetical protein